MVHETELFCTVQHSWATRRDKWLKGKRKKRTISVLVLSEYQYLETLVFSPFNLLTWLGAREHLVYSVAMKATDHTKVTLDWGKTWTVSKRTELSFRKYSRNRNY
jgi:hypothetical protein